MGGDIYEVFHMNSTLHESPSVNVLSSTMASQPSPSPANDLQTLLRFLTQDARIPLSTALSKIPSLRSANLTTPSAISKSTLQSLTPIFSGDTKLGKQVLAAAKRVPSSSNPQSRKRPATTSDDPLIGRSHKRSGGKNVQSQSTDLEASLAIPSSTLPIEDLRSITILTNRAPLLLAFAVTVLEHTMPEQPRSSRFSLAQAVVSANSRSKARSIGLAGAGGRKEEEEEMALGEGQPKVRALGREVAVMRRGGYATSDVQGDDGDIKAEEEPEARQATVQGEREEEREGQQDTGKDERPIYWGLDIEALRKTNTNNNTGNQGHHLPIHTPQSAHSYLLKSFSTLAQEVQIKQPSSTGSTTTSTKHKNKTKDLAEEKRQALSHLLTALHHLISSWSSTLSAEELDGKAWSWYVRVRPDVATGEKGWGQKGAVKLGDILDLAQWSGR